MDWLFTTAAAVSEGLSAALGVKSVVAGITALIVAALLWVANAALQKPAAIVKSAMARHWPVLGGAAALALAAVAAREMLATVVLLLAAPFVVWRLEKLRARKTGSKKALARWQRLAQARYAAAALALALVAALAGQQVMEWRSRTTQVCLLLAFESTGVVEPKIVQGAWAAFARTWHEVFARVEGLTIYPLVASSEEFDRLDVGRDRAAVLALAATMQPDIVLRTTVNIPGKSVLLSSQVCGIQDGDTRCTPDAFMWRGSLDSVEHTALQGAADLLRHLRALGSPPLSDAQHSQVARHLLERFSVFLSVQEGLEPTLAADVKQALAGTAIADADIATLLGRFTVAAAIEADAKDSAAARKATLAQVSVAQ